MLTLKLPTKELFDSRKNEFFTAGGGIVHLEHSLRAVAEWEAKWEKPYFGKEERHAKTTEEAIDYLKCMVLNRDENPLMEHLLTDKLVERIAKYIGSKQTATWFPRDTSPPSREIITAELIYYYMVKYNIPFECDTWHLNRLMTLIKVCNLNENSGKGSKTSKQELAMRNKALNSARRAKLGTKG